MDIVNSHTMNAKDYIKVRIPVSTTHTHVDLFELELMLDHYVYLKVKSLLCDECLENPKNLIFSDEPKCKKCLNVIELIKQLEND